MSAHITAVIENRIAGHERTTGSRPASIELTSEEMTQLNVWVKELDRRGLLVSERSPDGKRRFRGVEICSRKP